MVGLIHSREIDFLRWAYPAGHVHMALRTDSETQTKNLPNTYLYILVSKHFISLSVCMYTLLTLFCSGIFNWVAGLPCYGKREGVQATRQKNVPGVISRIVAKLVSWDGELSQKFLGS